jgi:hypothetical protein
MDTLLSIVAEAIGWLTGKKASEEIDKGNKKGALFFGIVFLLLVFGMGAYSIYWLATTLFIH